MSRGTVTAKQAFLVLIVIAVLVWFLVLSPYLVPSVVQWRGSVMQSKQPEIQKALCMTDLDTEPACFDVNGNWNPTGTHAFTHSSSELPTFKDLNCPTTLGAGAPYNCGSNGNPPNTCNCGPAPKAS